jgi:hypothetical protein
MIALAGSPQKTSPSLGYFADCLLRSANCSDTRASDIFFFEKSIGFFFEESIAAEPLANLNQTFYIAM